MKITAIETLVCHARMRNWVFVKVVTDQPGLIGWGEATLEWHTRSIVGAIEDMSHLLIGEDPTRVEYLWQMMYRQHFWHGHGIVRATAIAGIDLALWDIVGKVANMPLSKVFGGPVRDWVRTYCHLGGGKMEDFYQTPADNAKRFAELAQAGRGGWLHRLQKHGGAEHDAHRRHETRPRSRSSRRGDARGRGAGHRHHGRLPCAALAGHGTQIRQSAR
jgi:L-alanine-DL-glutamate epimerase-like enolase superfamily enzyme